MEKELLRCLLAAFPELDPPPLEAARRPSQLVIRGYRVAFDSGVDDAMLGALAERRTQTGLGNATSNSSGRAAKATSVEITMAPAMSSGCRS